MTATEALDFYTRKKQPSEVWMRINYSHFWPKDADYKIREEFQKNRKGRKRIMKDMFA